MFVIPARAAIQVHFARWWNWIPVCAGMTAKEFLLDADTSHLSQRLSTLSQRGAGA
jgi:hypothetical protein